MKKKRLVRRVTQRENNVLLLKIVRARPGVTRKDILTELNRSPHTNIWISDRMFWLVDNDYLRIKKGKQNRKHYHITVKGSEALLKDSVLKKKRVANGYE